MNKAVKYIAMLPELIKKSHTLMSKIIIFITNNITNKKSINSNSSKDKLRLKTISLLLKLKVMK